MQSERTEKHILPVRLLLETETPLLSDDGQVAGFELFRLSTSFDEFWSLLRSMLLAEELLQEPKLQSRLDGHQVMTLEKWSWFLVQVQNEERRLAFFRALGALEEPWWRLPRPS